MAVELERVIRPHTSLVLLQNGGWVGPSAVPVCNAHATDSLARGTDDASRDPRPVVDRARAVSASWTTANPVMDISFPCFATHTVSPSMPSLETRSRSRRSPVSTRQSVRSQAGSSSARRHPRQLCRNHPSEGDSNPSGARCVHVLEHDVARLESWAQASCPRSTRDVGSDMFFPAAEAAHPIFISLQAPFPAPGCPGLPFPSMKLSSSPSTAYD